LDDKPLIDRTMAKMKDTDPSHIYNAFEIKFTHDVDISVVFLVLASSHCYFNFLSFDRSKSPSMIPKGLRQTQPSTLAFSELLEFLSDK